MGNSLILVQHFCILLFFFLSHSGSIKKYCSPPKIQGSLRKEE